MAVHGTIIGSPGSGRSIFAAVMVKQLAKRRQRVILVSSDSIIPMLFFYCGDTDVMGLGELLNEDVTKERTTKAIKLLPKCPEIGVMGFQFDENKSDIQPGRIKDLMAVLDELVDVVLWDLESDCNSNFHRAVLQDTNVQYCILTADLKGVLYYENHRHIIRRLKNCMLLEGMRKPYSPYEELSARVGGLDGGLPYSREIERLAVEGKVFHVDKYCHEIYLSTAEAAIERLFHKKEG